MKLFIQVGLSPGHKKGGTAPPILAHVYCGQTVGWIKITSRGGRPRPRPHCVRWGPSFPSPKGAQPQVLAHVCCGQTAGWMKMPHGMEVGLGPGDTVLDGDPASP